MKGLFSSAAYKVDVCFQKPPAFIYPAASYEAPRPGLPQDATVEGNLLLDVSKAVTLQSITLRHVFYWFSKLPGDSFRTGDLEEYTAKIQSQRTSYVPGHYTLPFTLTLPCTQVGVSHVKTPTGYAATRSVTEVDIVDGKGNVVLHKINTRLKTLVDPECECLNFQLVACASDAGELPPPLTCIVQGFVECLGVSLLILCNATCPLRNAEDVQSHIVWTSTVTHSFLVRCEFIFSLKLDYRIVFRMSDVNPRGRIDFAVPEPPLDIVSVKLAVIETAELSFPASSGTSNKPVSFSHKVEFAGARGQHGGPLHRSNASKSPWNFSSIIRYPHDEQCVPTTLDGLSTPLRISHQLLINITLMETQGREINTKFARDITIGSCMAFADSVLLPTYKEEKAQPLSQQDFQPLRVNDPWPCQCGRTVEQLLAESTSIKRTESLNNDESEPLNCKQTS